MKLLRDAAAGLEEPFLLVVAGEFNSGKSSAVNALLGGRFLTEGVLPTTNEISVLHYGGSPSATVRSETAADGRLDIYLPCEILQVGWTRSQSLPAAHGAHGAPPSALLHPLHRMLLGYLAAPGLLLTGYILPVPQELAIVDTPGTNVILERQQRLTEEFIPRADLVLFVLSTDRPFTESEVSFLKYIRRATHNSLRRRDLSRPREGCPLRRRRCIRRPSLSSPSQPRGRKWDKRVLFLLNKTDLLESQDELAEVVKFVSKSANSLLGAGGAPPALLVLPCRG